MFIGDNLKMLRKRAGKSQEDIANELGFNRSTYSGYENGVAQPNIENLIIFSQFYSLTIDQLLKLNLVDFKESDWLNLEQSWQEKASGSNLRILTSQVDEHNEELVEIVTLKASAGYVHGYADPEYINELATLSIPFLSKNKKHRTFPIMGDSMPPVVNGSYVIASFVQDWTTIKSGLPYIVITKEEGIVFKMLHNHLEESRSFLLESTNTFYKPYELKMDDILEIWSFVSYISSALPAVQMDENEMGESIRSIQKDMHLLLNRYKA